MKKWTQMLLPLKKITHNSYPSITNLLETQKKQVAYSSPQTMVLALVIIPFRNFVKLYIQRWSSINVFNLLPKYRAKHLDYSKNKQKTGLENKESLMNPRILMETIRWLSSLIESVFDVSKFLVLVNFDNVMIIVFVENVNKIKVI